MDKKELIGEIVDLADKVEALLKKAKAEEVSFKDLENAARKRLFDYIKSYSLGYSYSVEKDGKLLTLFEWLDTLDMGIFSAGCCKELNNHSMNDLIGYFMDELSEVYDAKLDEIEQASKGKKEGDAD